MLSSTHTQRKLVTLVSAAALVVGTLWALQALADHKPGHNPGGGGGDPPPTDTGRIAYSQILEDASGQTVIQLLVLDLDASATTVVADLGSGGTPAWSHTDDAQGRRWILFVGHPTETTGRGIWAVKEDGSGLHLVFGPTSSLLPFNWVVISPHDLWLAYVGIEPGNGSHLYIQAFEAATATVSGNRINLTNGSPSSPSNPSWAPGLPPSGGSAGIAFSSSDLGIVDVYRLDLSFTNGGLTFDRVAGLVDLTAGVADGGWSPDWSSPTAAWPNGRIIFRADRSTIWHIDPYDPSDIQRVQGGARVYLPGHWTGRPTRPGSSSTASREATSATCLPSAPTARHWHDLQQAMTCG